MNTEIVKIIVTRDSDIKIFVRHYNSAGSQFETIIIETIGERETKEDSWLD